MGCPIAGVAVVRMLTLAAPDQHLAWFPNKHAPKKVEDLNENPKIEFRQSKCSRPTIKRERAKTIIDKEERQE